MPADAHPTPAALDAFATAHGAAVPAALIELYREHGAVTIGGLLHLERLDDITSHRARVGHLLDPDDEDLIAPTASLE